MAVKFKTATYSFNLRAFRSVVVHSRAEEKAITEIKCKIHEMSIDVSMLTG